MPPIAVRIATKGPKSGQCNICGLVGPLTEDHTPPKGCYRPSQIEIQSLLRRLSTTTAGPKSRHSQNGVKYRTLCHQCNNSLLGAEYDPHFISFVNNAANILRSPLVLPQVLSVPACPQPIMRSLLGHLSAQGVNRYKKGPHTEQLRDYIQDRTLPLPAPLQIFYWAFPFRSHVMARDAAYIDRAAAKPFAIWFLKFYPLAFLVTWDGPPAQAFPFPVQSMEPWRTVAYADQTDLPLRLSPLPPEYWPEAPTNESVVAYGQEAVNVRAKR